MMSRLCKTEKFIEKAIKKHGDKYVYNKVNYVNNITGITIICNSHGEFTQRPNDHLSGYGCKKCGVESMKTKTRYNNDTFIEKANKIHDTKYDYSKVDYTNSQNKVTIVCKLHGEFMQLPANHLRGVGCPKCANDFTGSLKRHTKEEFVENAIKIHGIKYDYDQVNYLNNSTKVTIACDIHGTFEQTPSDHLSGCGCKKCGYISTSEKLRLSTDQFIENAIEIHNDLYDYSKVNYIGWNVKVVIICGTHGDFEQIPYSHLNGHGCAKCGADNTIILKRKTNTEFIEEAIEVHDDKYNYNNVNYINTHTNVEIICNQHGSFLQQPKSHLNGYGCAKCNMCPSCGLFRTRGKLCSYCQPAETNELYKKLYIKTKEFAVVKFLRESLPDEEFIHNKSVGIEFTGTHLYPDILFERDGYNVIVEVDEHGHRGSGYQCEEKRMYDIIAKTARPTIFIRYNPDGCKDSKYSLETLLERVAYYLDCGEGTWDEKTALKVEYLFYKDKV